MAVEIGGERSWKVMAKGDIGISFQWVNSEPAMILYPLHNRIPNAGAFIICLSALHKYMMPDGSPNPDYATPASIQAAKTMGMSNDKMTCFRILDAIYEATPELVNMPPEPDWSKIEKKAETAGELIIKADGKTITEKEVPMPSENEIRALQ